MNILNAYSSYTPVTITRTHRGVISRRVRIFPNSHVLLLSRDSTLSWLKRYWFPSSHTHTCYCSERKPYRMQETAKIMQILWHIRNKVTRCTINVSLHVRNHNIDEDLQLHRPSSRSQRSTKATSQAPNTKTFTTKVTYKREGVTDWKSLVWVKWKCTNVQYFKKIFKRIAESLSNKDFLKSYQFCRK